MGLCTVQVFFIVHVHYIYNRIKINVKEVNFLSEIGSEKRNGFADEWMSKL